MNSAHRCGLDCFPALKDILKQMDECTEFREVLYDELVHHVADLVDALSQYYPDEAEVKLQDYSWVKNQFSCTEKPCQFTTLLYEKFIDMVSDSSL